MLENSRKNRLKWTNESMHDELNEAANTLHMWTSDLQFFGGEGHSYVFFEHFEIQLSKL